MFRHGCPCGTACPLLFRSRAELSKALPLGPPQLCHWVQHSSATGSTTALPRGPPWVNTHHATERIEKRGAPMMWVKRHHPHAHKCVAKLCAGIDSPDGGERLAITTTPLVVAAMPRTPVDPVSDLPSSQLVLSLHAVNSVNTLGEVPGQRPRCPADEGEVKRRPDVGAQRGGGRRDTRTLEQYLWPIDWTGCSGTWLFPAEFDPPPPVHFTPPPRARRRVPWGSAVGQCCGTKKGTTHSHGRGAAVKAECVLALECRALAEPLPSPVTAMPRGLPSPGLLPPGVTCRAQPVVGSTNRLTRICWTGRAEDLPNLNNPRGPTCRAHIPGPGDLPSPCRKRCRQVGQHPWLGARRTDPKPGRTPGARACMPSAPVVKHHVHLMAAVGHGLHRILHARDEAGGGGREGRPPVQRLTILGKYETCVLP
eukprot:gene22471-biopygen1176